MPCVEYSGNIAKSIPGRPFLAPIIISAILRNELIQSAVRFKPLLRRLLVTIGNHFCPSVKPGHLILKHSTADRVGTGRNIAVSRHLFLCLERNKNKLFFSKQQFFFLLGFSGVSRNRGLAWNTLRRAPKSWRFSLDSQTPPPVPRRSGCPRAVRARQSMRHAAHGAALCQSRPDSPLAPSARRLPGPRSCRSRPRHARRNLTLAGHGTP